MKLKNKLFNKLIEVTKLIDGDITHERSSLFAKEAIKSKNYCILMTGCWGGECSICNKIFAEKFNLPLIYETNKKRIR